MRDRKNEILESGDLDQIKSFVSGMQEGADFLRQQRDDLQVENEKLRDAVKRAADTCRLQRKSWDSELEDEKVYLAWTKEIEYYEGLLK